MKVWLSYCSNFSLILLCLFLIAMSLAVFAIGAETAVHAHLLRGVFLILAGILGVGFSGGSMIYIGTHKL